MNLAEQLIKDTLTKNPNVAKHATDAAWIPIPIGDLRAVWHCYGCELTLTGPADNIFTGTPHCNTCNTFFTLSNFEHRRSACEERQQKTKPSKPPSASPSN